MRNKVHNTVKKYNMINKGDTVLVALEFAVDYDAPGIIHRVREADVGGGVDEYLVPG